MITDSFYNFADIDFDISYSNYYVTTRITLFCCSHYRLRVFSQRLNNFNHSSINVSKEREKLHRTKIAQSYRLRKIGQGINLGKGLFRRISSLVGWSRYHNSRREARSYLLA